jgi:hypothetical protein
MRNKIAVPDTPYLKDLFANADKVKKEYDIEFFIVPENQIGEYFHNNRFDLALLSPADYAMGIGNADYRIVDGPCFAAEAFTRLASVYFKPNLASISSIGSASKDNFMVQIAKLLMAERYEIYSEIRKSSTEIEEALTDNDAFITLTHSDNAALDISEEWYLNSSSPLPLAFWVCRNEEAPESMIEILNKLAIDFYKSDIIIQEHSEDELMVREGRIMRHWNEEISKSLVEVMELLYYHQIIPEIGDVKMYGYDD